MKTVKLITIGEYTTRKLIQELASISPQGMTLTQMRARIRLLDALDASKEDELVLEDSDYSELKNIIEGVNTWMRADRDLIKVIDGIVKL